MFGTWLGILLSFLQMMKSARCSTGKHFLGETKNSSCDWSKWFMANAKEYIISALTTSAFPTRELKRDPVKHPVPKETHDLSRVSQFMLLVWSMLELLWQKGRFQGLCGLYFLASNGFVVLHSVNPFQELRELLSVLSFPCTNLSQHPGLKHWAWRGTTQRFWCPSGLAGLGAKQSWCWWLDCPP